MYEEGQFSIYTLCFIYRKLRQANVLAKSKSAEYNSLDEFWYIIVPTFCVILSC